MKQTVSQGKIKYRYAYIKNGDVVEELKALADIPEDNFLENGGPFHYIGSFLKWTEGSKALLISLDMHHKRLQSKNRLTVQVINTKCFPNFWRKLMLQFSAAVQIFISLINFRPTWVLCAISGGMPLAACFFAARFCNVPFIHTRHMRVEHFEPSIFSKFRSMIDHWFIRNADTVLCNGPYLQDQLLSIGVKSERIIQFGLPYRKIQDPPVLNKACPISRADVCRLLYIGRVEENKGALDLFLACRRLIQIGTAVSLTYIGDGQFLKPLMRLVKRLELEGRVFFLGHMDHSMALQAMRNYDILIVPTKQKLGEGRCKSVIEGLILGIPIIAPNYGAFKYLVKDGINGLLYPPDDKDTLASTIKFLVEHPDLRHSLAENAKKSGDLLRIPDKTFLQALDEATRQKSR